MEKDRHLVFMYGTLKTSEPNHKQLYAKSPDGSIYVGLAKTVLKFPLIITTPFNIPFLLHKEGTGHQITGELYQVDEETLKHLDWFEGHPHWYERKLTHATMISDRDGNKCQPEEVECWIYGLPRFKSSLLELPLVEVYHDQEAEIHKRFRPYDPVRDGPLHHYLFDNDSQ